MPEESNFLQPAVWSYGVALLGFLAFGVQVVVGRRANRRASILVAALAFSAIWAGTAVYLVLASRADLWWAYRIAESLRVGAWLWFLLSLWPPANARDAISGARKRRYSWLHVAAVALPVVAALMPFPAPWLESRDPGAARLAYAGSLGLAVLGLAIIEQLVRNASEEGRWRLKPLLLGLGAAFSFELFMYADALLFARVQSGLWAASGLVQVLVLPFIAMATVRNRDWSIDIAVSRGVVFHSTALLGAGLLLLVMAGAGYYVQYFGGTWGRMLQVALTFGALLGLAFLALSGTARARLWVFINKNFFSYRYDYRHEWLRVTNLLSGRGDTAGLNERVVRALADLVESPGGALWMCREAKGYSQIARWNFDAVVTAVEPADGSLVRFLEREGWVIDLDELRAKPAAYSGTEAPAWLAALGDAWLVVPLPAFDGLVGFVILARPRVPIDVNWEVRDLLKTAARQAASYLAQIGAAEALLETEKFAAFNRMSAFVVHDLKNLVAQLSLMLKNAERHSENPEFQRDMLETVRHVVERMHRMLLQLRLGTSPVENARPVDLSDIARRVGQAKRLACPRLRVEADAPVLGLGHDDRLEHVIGHLVQNAIDATRSAGNVAMRVLDDAQHAVVEVEDDGEGMTREFIQSRLFKPFQTTKREGMGIGTYESQQYVAALGGSITVDSAPGRGTRIRLLLPRAGVQPLAANDLKDVA